MSDAGKQAAAGELAHDPATTPHADDPTSAAIEATDAIGEAGETDAIGETDGTDEHADRQAHHLERARRLGRRLGVPVSIDETGWLRGGVALLFTKQPDGTLRPVRVRVDYEVSDREVLAEGGVIAHCRQYNRALRKLHQLAARLTEAVRQGRITLAPGSPVAYAHRELARLDDLIARRQASTMSRGVVLADTLIHERAFFARCDAHLAPIVQAAERAGLVHTPPAASIARRALRWLLRLARIHRVRAAQPRRSHQASHPPERAHDRLL